MKGVEGCKNKKLLKLVLLLISLLLMYFLRFWTLFKTDLRIGLGLETARERET